MCQIAVSLVHSASGSTVVAGAFLNYFCYLGSENGNLKLLPQLILKYLCIDVIVCFLYITM
jgi:hypothetical protein